MSKADRLRYFWMHERGEEYEWGDEGSGGPAGNDAYDCSGGHFAALRYAGVYIPRLTAHGYYHRAKRIRRPSRVGDFFVLLDGSHAHHIGDYIGDGQTAEARGEAYGLRVYTVRQANSRGAVWMRDPSYDLGRLTKDTPTYFVVSCVADRKRLSAWRLWALAMGQTTVYERRGESWYFAVHCRRALGWRFIHGMRRKGLHPHYVETHHRAGKLREIVDGRPRP